MKIITIAHQKGGVGKSTISLNLAYAIYKSGYKVALKDSDVQGTTFACSQKIEVFTDFNNINSEQYDYLVVDTPPYLTTDYLSLFNLSDIVIIPTQPTIADVLELPKTVQILKQAQFKKPNLKGVIVYNKVVSGSLMIDDVEDEVISYNLPVLKTILEQRLSYGRTLLDDEGVFSSKDKKAQNEINSLLSEILTYI